MRRLFTTLFIVILVLITGACAGASAGSGGTTKSGLDLAITTSSIDSSLSMLSSSVFSTSSDISVSEISFRGSELSFYSIDDTALDGIKNYDDGDEEYTAAFNSISASQVKMDLPDELKTVTFSRTGNSSLPIDEVGNFKNQKYNMININIGGGMFIYETADPRYILEADAGTYVINALGVDLIRVSNILLVDEALWEDITGEEAAIKIYENNDYYEFDTYPSSLDSEGMPVGNCGFYSTDNALMAFLRANSDYRDFFDIDGCIVYPMNGPIDLTSYTQLEQGYNNIDPDSANLDIRINMSWQMPDSATMNEAVDPDTVSLPDESDYPLVYYQLLNRQIEREENGENIYNFSVSVEVTER